MSPMTTPATPMLWAQHLAQPAAVASTPLTPTEAERVQRHRDQLMRALLAQDRAALLSAKQQVLAAAFSPRSTHGTASAADSPALRGALRDLSWRMVGLLLPRGTRH